jgi:hypothetical protein
VTGSGWLGQQLGLQSDSGIFLGGVWVGNGNYCFRAANNRRGRASTASLLPT